MIYLATPYTHADKHIEIQRFETVTKEAARIMELGQNVISPITHGVPLCMVNQNLPTDFLFWHNHCLDLLKRCDEMYVLEVDGWKESRGVQTEIEFARKRNIPIHFIKPSEANES